MSRAADVLVLTADEARATLLCACLREGGYQVARGRDVNAIEALPARLVVLDATPGQDLGVGAARERAGGPLVVVSADASDDAELAALSAGADDFVRTPLDPRILRARVRRLLKPHASCVVGDVVVDRSRRSATANGQRVPLTEIELDVVWALATRTGEVVTRDRLYRDVLKVEYDGRDRGLDIHVSRIRPKLSPHRVSIVAVRGSGYVLVADTVT